MKRALLPLFLAVFLLSCGEREELRIRKGALDLHGRAFSISGTARLRGGWLFSAGKSYKAALRKLNHPDRSSFQDPGYFWYWHRNRKKGRGYALFRLEIRGGSPDLSVLSFDPGMHFSAWRVLLDGKPVAESGFSTEGTGRCRLRIQPAPVFFALSRPLHRLELQTVFVDRTGGGKPGPLYLKTARVMSGSRSTAAPLKLFLGGAFVLFGFYHIWIFFFQRRYRGFLWLGLFSLLLFVRSLLEDEYFLLQLIGGLRSDWYYRLLYLTLHLAFPLYTAFFNDLYPVWKLRYVPVVFYLLSGIAFALSFFIHYVDLFIVNRLYFYVIVAALFFFLGRVWVEIRKKTPGSLLFFIGMLLFAGFVVHDIFAIAGSYTAPRYLYFGLLLFVVVQAIILARGYSRAVAGLRELLDRPDELEIAFNRYGFTGREREVAQLLIRGVKYREIGERLFISIKTVKFHSANIYRKCRAANRTEFLNRILLR